MSSGFKKHVVSILHNAGGSLIAVGAIALFSGLLGFVPAARSMMVDFLALLIPLWVSLATLTGVCLLMWVVGFAKKKTVLESSEEIDEIDPEMSDWQWRQELDRQAKTIKDKTKEIKRQERYIAQLRARLTENGIQVPAPPPPSVGTIVPERY